MNSNLYFVIRIILFIIVPILAMQKEIEVASGNHQEELLNEEERCVYAGGFTAI